MLGFGARRVLTVDREKAQSEGKRCCRDYMGNRIRSDQ